MQERAKHPSPRRETPGARHCGTGPARTERARSSDGYIPRTPEWWNGRHAGLKIPCRRRRVSSTLTSGIRSRSIALGGGRRDRRLRARDGRCDRRCDHCARPHGSARNCIRAKSCAVGRYFPYTLSTMKASLCPRLDAMSCGSSPAFIWRTA